MSIRHENSDLNSGCEEVNYSFLSLDKEKYIKEADQWSTGGTIYNVQMDRRNHILDASWDQGSEVGSQKIPE